LITFVRNDLITIKVTPTKGGSQIYFNGKPPELISEGLNNLLLSELIILQTANRETILLIATVTKTYFAEYVE
jgi:hypothetical protein